MRRSVLARTQRAAAAIGALLLLLVACAAPARADGKVVLYGLSMVPGDLSAKADPRPGIGVGAEFVEPLPRYGGLFALAGGLELVNMRSTASTVFDEYSQSSTAVISSQDFVRAYLGGQMGSHGRGLVRPYVGLNLAVIVYDYASGAAPVDGADPPVDAPSDAASMRSYGIGWDANVGVDLNIRNVWSLDGGVRYLHSDGAPRVWTTDDFQFQSAYVQYRIGIGFNHDFAHDPASAN